MTAHAISLFLMLVVELADVAGLDDAAKALEHARRHYDRTEAKQVHESLRDLVGESPGDESRRLLGDACLLLAELCRIEFENTPKSNYTDRRGLGEQIDDAAQEGLHALQSVAEDSEVFRRRADLIGTMIRSDFQAKKHKKSMNEATAKALELDPKNARAHVTAAKPYLFAEPSQGGDVHKAMELLSKALELSPGLEPALLLRAYAYTKLGDREKALKDYQTALQANPACKPAQDEIRKLTSQPDSKPRSSGYPPTKS